MTIVVPMRKVTKGITAKIVITGQRTFNARCWLAIKLMQLAALVFPIKTEVEVKR